MTLVISSLREDSYDRGLYNASNLGLLTKAGSVILVN